MLPELTPYTFGTMTVGRDVNRIKEDLQIIRGAMEAGVWFHTCRNYSSMATYNLLAKGFAEDPGSVPPVIAKIRCYNEDILRYDIEDTCDMLGKEQIEIAQLSMKSGESKKKTVDDFINGGPVSEVYNELKEKGRVGSAVLEVFYNMTPETLDALEYDLFDGYTFYYSILQRETSNEVFEMIRETGKPILALCAGAGGCADPAWYERKKAEDPDARNVKIYEEIKDLIQDTEISWGDLVYGFLLQQENVQTCIAGTATLKHLLQNITTARSCSPVPSELIERILAIHTTWMAKA